MVDEIIVLLIYFYLIIAGLSFVVLMTDDYQQQVPFADALLENGFRSISWGFTVCDSLYQHGCLWNKIDGKCIEFNMKGDMDAWF